MSKHSFKSILKKLTFSSILLVLCAGATPTKSPYNAARRGDLAALRQYRFEGKDLFISDERGFTPYELAALHADPDSNEGLRKQVEVMLWLKEYKPEKHHYGKATIKLIQSGLNALGYDVGTPDGKLGNRTTTAIKSYQKANKLAETGRPGPQWLGTFYRDIVKDTQFKLTKIGFNTRGTDGLMGNNTRSAILSYRDQKKLSDPKYVHLDSLLINSVNRSYKKVNDEREAKIALSTRQAQSRENQFIQAGLRTLGYRIGKIDGVAGSKTTNAVKSFQKKYKLKATGDPDLKTMAKMNTVFLKETQRKLNKLGYKVGKPDGKAGKRTLRAITKYKKSVRLKNSQGLDATLIAAIDDSYDNRRVAAVKKPSNSRRKSNVKTTIRKNNTNNTQFSSNSSAKTSSKIIKPSYASTSSRTKKGTNIGAREAKGRMAFRRKGGRVVGCALAGRKIPIEWCEPFYPLPKKNHCEASFKPSSGVVINLWCK